MSVIERVGAGHRDGGGSSSGQLVDGGSTVVKVGRARAGGDERCRLVADDSPRLLSPTALGTFGSCRSSSFRHQMGG